MLAPVWWRDTSFYLRLFVVVIIAILSGLIGESYSRLVYGPEEGEFYLGFRTGFTIGAISALIEVFYIRAVRRSWIRRTAFLPGLVVRILALTLIVRIGLVGNELLTDYIAGRPLVLDFEPGQQVRDTLFSMGIVIVFVVLSQLSTIIGFKRFLNLVIGRYFRPVSEERIFLFLDLVDSTRLARRLGDVRFHEYLAEFFYQCDQAIVRTGGEIVSYVGDAVIATWPLGEDGQRNARCLKALNLVRQRMVEHAPEFEKEFGSPPRFRAALHGGAVVVGECGDSRRQVMFLGDVVNMTARIEAVAKQYDEPFLISHELLEKLELPPQVHVEAFLAVELKGADSEFALNRLKFA